MEFFIPCVIGNTIINREICDLETRVNLMFSFDCKILDLGERKVIKKSLQLDDRYIKYLVGVLEYVPTRIGQLYIPTDFIVTEMEEDTHIPILLSVPFLAIDGAIIGIRKGKLTFEVEDEKTNFILSKFMKNKSIDDSCFQVDIIDECVIEYLSYPLLTDWFEACLIGSTNLKNNEAQVYEILLDKIHGIKN